jgi:hypothetical protein
MDEMPRKVSPSSKPPKLPVLIGALIGIVLGGGGGFVFGILQGQNMSEKSASLLGGAIVYAFVGMIVGAAIREHLARRVRKDMPESESQSRPPRASLGRQMMLWACVGGTLGVAYAFSSSGQLQLIGLGGMGLGALLGAVLYRFQP